MVADIQKLENAARLSLGDFHEAEPLKLGAMDRGYLGLLTVFATALLGGLAFIMIL